MNELTTINTITTTLLAVLGACAGSFINVAALRRGGDFSFISGRSHCPSCRQTIKWYDLVPVLSWLLLAGRCRACKVRISSRYPLVELTGGAVFALCFAVFGFSYMTLLAIGVSSVLMAVSLIDLGTTEIPNGLIIALVPFAVAAYFVQPEISLISRGIGFFAVSLPLLALAVAISGAFGGGDIKLVAVCGFLLWWQNILLAFFVAVLLGGSYAVYLLTSGKRKRREHMVFGPALCAGIIFAMFFGEQIISWYWGLFNA